MRIDILTIFPQMFDCVLNESILKRAQEKGKLWFIVHNLRDYTVDKHKKVDDKPFGGGPGMIMQVQPIHDALKEICKLSKIGKKQRRIILLSPQGKTMEQKVATRLSKYKHLILICAHYEGVDERVRKYLADEEISIGDYVLTGGELPAMVLVDAVTRLIPGVLGKKESLHQESFHDNLLEYPQYSRPADFKGMKVPTVLLSGDHNKIKDYRKKESLRITKEKRPDLFKKYKT
ncbi:MAG: tRNA (guanosine(37)-N1)-methyltransferase TrmD [Candidatus Omnitrophica bacterium]|nr:tRNA (guanosine(37)-N1)-methyltransferase TrmD [Candidatus Omnitrophota bacterium]HOX53897.1 tRNA (guanosine(37)-N1)-methyltransferase TrmD [Candidatus Omnitrophota bacterium]